MTRYGFSSQQWEAGREEIRRTLIARAREGRTISYSELISQVHTVRLSPDASALAAMLGEISEAEDAQGRGMLSVLVVHRDGDMRPGLGFFELARKLGRDTSDTDRFWLEELKRVTDSWRQQ